MTEIRLEPRALGPCSLRIEFFALHPHVTSIGSLGRQRHDFHNKLSYLRFQETQVQSPEALNARPKLHFGQKNMQRRNGTLMNEMLARDKARFYCLDTKESFQAACPCAGSLRQVHPPVVIRPGAPWKDGVIHSG